MEYTKVYEFLRTHMRHSRFEGKGKDCAANLAQYHLDALHNSGWSVISRHSSYNAQVVTFDCNLVDLNADKPPVEYEPNTGHLTHLLD